MSNIFFIFKIDKIEKGLYIFIKLENIYDIARMKYGSSFESNIYSENNQITKLATINQYEMQILNEL